MMEQNSNKVALVAGANGVVGRQLIQTLQAEGWKVTGLSRRRPDDLTSFPWLEVDLLDEQASRAQLAGQVDVTHLFFLPGKMRRTGRR